MGTEFRPLGELDKYLRANPFQDPNRGRIKQCIPTASAAVNTTKPVKGGLYNTILRNQLISLSGKDSIMGRGVKAYQQTLSTTDTTKCDSTATAVPIDCCVIGEDVPPTTSAAYHYHGYGHGYGGHGYHGHGHTTTHTHNDTAGHGYGVGSHTHAGYGHHGNSGYGGYSTGSHSHGTGANKVTQEACKADPPEATQDRPLTGLRSAPEGLQKAFEKAFQT